MSLFTETVDLKIRGGKTGDYDARGNPIYKPDRTETVPAWYEPRDSTEAVVAQDQQVWGFWLYLPGDTEMDDVYAVMIRGAEYHIVGEPGFQPGGFIVDSYFRLAVERTTG